MIARVFAAKMPHAELMAQGALRSRLQGKVGQPVTVTFIDGTGKPVEKSIDRAPARGVVTSLGFLPPMRVWLESKRIGSDIGYIRFNQFLDPPTIMKQYEDAVLSCLKCRGMIIDLRGNTGGIGIMATGMAGFFSDRGDLKLGKMIMRQTTLNFIINPRPQTYDGPVAVLIDGMSASTAEIFAGGLQDLKRARVFGTRSAGAALPSTIKKLPNGDGFQYAQANYISEGGLPLEGRGVTPDVEAKQSREALLNGHDRVVDSAVEWIKGKHD
jgi:carboxyl-terminal processing protease